SGRSRQDIGATVQRLAMREDLLSTFDKLKAARAALIAEIAERNRAGLHLGGASATGHAWALSRRLRVRVRARRRAAASNLRASEPVAIGGGRARDVELSGRPAAARGPAWIRRRGRELA